MESGNKCAYCGISLIKVTETGTPYIEAVHHSPDGISIYAQGVGYLTPCVLFCSPDCRDIWLNTHP